MENSVQKTAGLRTNAENGGPFLEPYMYALERKYAAARAK